MRGKNLFAEECEMSNSTSVNAGNSLAKMISSILLTAAVISSVFAAPGCAALTQITPDTDWVADANTYNYNTDFDITSKEQLARLAALVNDGTYNFENKNIFLKNNITDLNGYEWVPIGNTSNPFKGTFDGEGHTIRYLSIDNTSGALSIGLFGNNAGTIQNLKLTNVDIYITSDATDAGGIAATNSGTVQGCTVSGSISVDVLGSDVGGIVGNNTNTVAGCTISGSITGNSTNGNVGGIAGNNSSILKNCVVSSASIAGKTAGALAGVNTDNGTIDNTNTAYTNVNVNGSAVSADSLVGMGSDTNDAKVTNPSSSTAAAAAGSMGCDAGFGFAGVIALAGAGLFYRRVRRSIYTDIAAPPQPERRLS
jgi:hypothetical protein